jgi:hypothetical protein
MRYKILIIWHRLLTRHNVAVFWYLTDNFCQCIRLLEEKPGFLFSFAGILISQTKKDPFKTGLFLSDITMVSQNGHYPLF